MNLAKENTMEVTKTENVTRIYKIGKVETQALRGVSLSIEKGEFTALVGPSGSGKTTLLQLLGCLDQPTSGRVFVNGKDVSRLNRSQRADMRRGTIGFIFQFFALIPTLSAYENIELPLLLNGHSASERSERRERVMELLESVDLSDRAHHRPDQLSGGEQQRVAVARALASRPVLVLADEPTANLDTANGKQVMEIMQRLNQETGTTFVFATHDPRVIAFARRVVELRDGRVAEG
jgi:putative ABC transport system ATP-binding protein